MAYDMSMFSAPDSTLKWLKMWATREFGADVADETADVVNSYSMYAARRKYELLDPSIYSVINYDEADTVLNVGEYWLTGFKRYTMSSLPLLKLHSSSWFFIPA